MPEIMNYKTNRTKTNEDALEDVMDGKLYQDRFENGYFTGSDPTTVRNECHLSLQANSDGVSPFKAPATKYELWPFYFTINEIPPKLRYARVHNIDTYN